MDYDEEIRRYSDPTNIIGRVPGEYLARATRTLPDPEKATEQFMDAVIDVPGIGTVRVTGKRMKSRKGKSTLYFWTPSKAVAV